MRIPTQHLLLACLLSTSTIVLAQLPAHDLRFVPVDNDSWPRTAKSAYYMPNETFITPNYIVHLEVASAGKEKGLLATYVKDISTGDIAGQHKRELPGDGNGYFDKLVLVDGQLFMIYETLDRKTGEVIVYAEGIELPSGQPAGPAQEIGKINFNPKGLTWMNKLEVELFTSDNGEFTAFYFDRIRSKEDEQLVLIFMLNKQLEPVWQQGYRIAFESDKISTAGVAVSDAGVVYALMGARFKNRAITNKDVNYGFELFGMSQEGMASQPITLDGGKSIVTCGVVLRNGNTPCVGGFHVAEGESTDITEGYFISDIDPGMEQPATTQTFRFSKPVEERMAGAEVFGKSDGSVFLVGNSKKISGTTMTESNLFAASFNASLKEEWATVVPKTLIASKSDEDHGYRAFFGKDHLMLMVPDLEENLSAHKKGGELKNIRKGANMHMLVGFSDTGAPSFGKIGAPKDYVLNIMWLPSNLKVQAGSYAFFATKKSDKTSTPGKLFLTFQ